VDCTHPMEMSVRIIIGRGPPAPARSVGRGSPDPAPSPTEGLPILEDAANEATARPLVDRGSPDRAPSPEVGRGSPGTRKVAAPSPTVGLPIHENATNEATALPHGGPSPEVDPPIPVNATNEPNGPARSFPARPTVSLTHLALLAFLGLAAAVIGADSPPRSDSAIEESRIAAPGGIKAIHPRRAEHRDGAAPPRANDFVEVGGRPIARGGPMAYKVPNDRHRSAPT
jgi:hypothetical protein